ncbi:unnamed protein product [Durusdinium trenchii]|uniref:Uncharacterized protein n=2 Tax=Durusdinium trenchii TaxID=1381693 RepID=A0ABP0N800_9DINO
MASSSSPAKWTPEDEWALSLLMQKRMNADTTGSFGPPSLPEKGALQSAGAMHDGSKRRWVAEPEAASEWEQVNTESAPSYAGKVRMDDTLFEEALVAALDASPVIGAASQKEADNDLPVDLPPGVDSLTQWGRTMMSFGQYKGKYCYHEIASGASFWDYKKWVRTHIKPGASKGAALDFASYLRAYDKEHGRSQLPVFPGTSIPRQFKDA